jgi:murein DD-endopeptidase MepM/ murein hydrolase activator NlpD
MENKTKNKLKQYIYDTKTKLWNKEQKIEQLEGHIERLSNSALNTFFFLCLIMAAVIFGFFTIQHFHFKYVWKISKMNKKINIYEEEVIAYNKAMSIMGIGGFEAKEIVASIKEDEYDIIESKFRLTNYDRRYPQFLYPVRYPEKAIILLSANEFGWRLMWWGKQFHRGFDTQSLKSFDVVAVGSGTVEKIDFTNEYGHRIIINHNNRYKSTYCHLNDYDVREGDYVYKGKTIATLGKSGAKKFCSNYHLHFEWQVFEDGKWVYYNFFRTALHKKKYFLKKG